MNDQVELREFVRGVIVAMEGVYHSGGTLGIIKRILAFLGYTSKEKILHYFKCIPKSDELQKAQLELLDKVFEE